MSDQKIKKLESIMSDLGKVHDMIAKTKLPTSEYKPISSLFATAKIELFNFYNEFKNAQNLPLDSAELEMASADFSEDITNDSTESACIRTGFIAGAKYIINKNKI